MDLIRRLKRITNGDSRNSGNSGNSKLSKKTAKAANQQTSKPVRGPAACHCRHESHPNCRPLVLSTRRGVGVDVLRISRCNPSFRLLQHLRTAGLSNFPTANNLPRPRFSGVPLSPPPPAPPPPLPPPRVLFISAMRKAILDFRPREKTPHRKRCKLRRHESLSRQ